ncbi:transmembrane 4 L6 family member 5-like [Misgurnus anguillicaudatus]|uniref:transmembrane 4 L6 family member 5-like n=1 Tax=Misgurnus anguillicaudatus TaxID=75329 RepID=UPI003CCF176C
MCTGECSLWIGRTLYPLALISIICNLMLFFPDWDVQYALNGQITEEVKLMGGLVGGGVMVLIPAFHIYMTGERGCCANRFGMFLSIILAAVGVAGAFYSFSVAVSGLYHGPLCKVGDEWKIPFENKDANYLKDRDSWVKCTEPKNVVKFNVVLFSILLLVSILQIILCGIQMINGLFGCLCGTCRDKDNTGHDNVNMTSLAITSEKKLYFLWESTGSDLARNPVTSPACAFPSLSPRLLTLRSTATTLSDNRLKRPAPSTTQTPTQTPHIVKKQKLSAEARKAKCESD